MRLLKPSRLLPAALALLAPGTATAQALTARSLPLAISVEGATIRSSALVRFDVVDYNQPLDAFTAARKEPREALFAQFMAALRAKDYARVRALMISPVRDGQRATEAETKFVVDASLRNFGGLQSVTVIAQVGAGERSVFVWEWRAAAGVVRRGVSIGDAAGVGLSARLVTSADVAGMLIVNEYQAAADDPAAYQPEANGTRRYALKLPTAGGGHPVLLLFDGDPQSFDLLDANAASPDPMLQFYQASVRKLRSGDLQQYTELFLPRSRKAAEEWFKKLSGNLAQFRQEYTEGRIVKLVLRADPVFIVYFTAKTVADPDNPPKRGEKPKEVPGALNYEYVVRDSASGGYKLANLGAVTALDRALKSPGVIDPQMLR